MFCVVLCIRIAWPVLSCIVLVCDSIMCSLSFVCIMWCSTLWSLVLFLSIVLNVVIICARLFFGICASAVFGFGMILLRFRLRIWYIFLD